MKRKKDIHVQVAQRLRLVRGKLSQGEFAQHIGVPFRTYQRYEAGENLPSGEVLNRISDTVGKPVDWILKGGEANETMATFSCGASEISFDKRSQEQLERILQEGDRKKIDLIKALLCVLDPENSNQTEK